MRVPMTRAAAVLACLVLAHLAFALPGCVGPEPVAAPAPPAAPATSEDHLALALLYQERAQELELEALRYEQVEAGIAPLEDPKGFRRAALRIAAQRIRQEAADLRALAERHQRSAEGLKGPPGS